MPPTRFLLLATLVGALACGGSDGTAPPVPPSKPAVASVAVALSTPSLVVGQTSTATATIRDAAGTALAGESVSWSSSNAQVATVQGGTVTAVGAGSARISATVRGVAGAADVTVSSVPVTSVTVTPAADTLWVGTTLPLAAVARDAGGAELTGRSITWTTSDPAIATVSADGRVTARGDGLATITATVDGVAGTGQLRVRTNPVRASSYENFKGAGIEPLSIPLPASPNWGFTDVVAHAYGDFYGRGVRGDLFTARIDYGTDMTEAEAPRSVYTFWRRDGGTYTPDNSILLPATTTCLHPRKALVADFNMDGRPDVFLLCHGYDAPPLPGERNQLLLSDADGRYTVRDAAPQVGFWHGGSAADLNGDGYPDVVAIGNYDPEGPAVFLNDGTGNFTLEPASRLPDISGAYYALELADVDADGDADLLAGGHEWEPNTSTAVWLNPGNADFRAVAPVVIPAVPNDGGVIADFVLTGTGATRTVWISRTSGGDGTFYESRVLQRFVWSTRTSSVVQNDRPASWVPWLLAYTRGGVSYVGSDDPRIPLEVVVP